MFSRLTINLLPCNLLPITHSVFPFCLSCFLFTNHSLCVPFLSILLSFPTLSLQGVAISRGGARDDRSLHRTCEPVLHSLSITHFLSVPFFSFPYLTLKGVALLCGSARYDRSLHRTCEPVLHSLSITHSLFVPFFCTLGVALSRGSAGDDWSLHRTSEPA
jgi:hypothetical protein